MGKKLVACFQSFYDMFAKFITKPTCNELGSKKGAKPKNCIFKVNVKLRMLTKPSG